MSEEQTKELSQEELEARREQITNFYKSNISHLKVQLEYEELLTKIEENRAKRLQSQVLIAQVYASQEENPATKKAKEEFEKQLNTTKV